MSDHAANVAYITFVAMMVLVLYAQNRYQIDPLLHRWRVNAEDWLHGLAARVHRNVPRNKLEEQVRELLDSSSS